MKTDAERYAENAKNLLLGTFTPQELLEALTKRDGVSSVNTKHDDYYWITVSGKDGIPDDPLRGIGETTIIVVRGKE